jgi:large subunit ribosomal protein L22
MNKKKKINRVKVDTVKSVNNNIRSSVRKLNPILAAIVGKKVDVAIRDLQFSAKRITKDIRKKIVMKRFRPRAKGRAAPILKPYSSVTIILSEEKKMESHGTKS